MPNPLYDFTNLIVELLFGTSVSNPVPPTLP